MGERTKVIRNEKGQALALALIVMMFGALVMGAFFYYITATVKASAMTREMVNAYYAADAGVELALADLIQDGSLPLGSYEWTGERINGYEPTIYITDEIPSPAPPPQYVLRYSDYLITSTAGGVTITCYARWIESVWGNFIQIVSWEIE